MIQRSFNHSTAIEPKYVGVIDLMFHVCRGGFEMPILQYRRQVYWLISMRFRIYGFPMKKVLSIIFPIIIRYAIFNRETYLILMTVFNHCCLVYCVANRKHLLRCDWIEKTTHLTSSFPSFWRATFVDVTASTKKKTNKRFLSLHWFNDRRFYQFDTLPHIVNDNDDVLRIADGISNCRWYIKRFRYFISNMAHLMPSSSLERLTPKCLN